MQVNITASYKPELIEPLDLEGLVRFVLEEMDLPINTDVTLSFVDNDEIHRLNREYRGMDKPTDVLSFECDNVPFEDEDFDGAEEFELGDVVIATDVAIAQTEEYGTTLKEEITLLTVHGLLHLCGYDHIEDDEAEVMEALERKLIAAWEQKRA